MRFRLMRQRVNNIRKFFYFLSMQVLVRRLRRLLSKVIISCSLQLRKPLVDYLLFTMPITHTPSLIQVNSIVRYSIIDKRLGGPVPLDIILGGLHVNSRL